MYIFCINNPKAKDQVLDMIEINNLTDRFRELYPDLKRYTWRKRTPLNFHNPLPSIKSFSFNCKIIGQWSDL
jgi:hypothetical protein